ncbi:zinc finger MYND domain-containing protein 12-like [Watersipora subatra]|uniref:zinc finger MYND domain-containing protein 12-like n=1 Tax=Watersipora subatra TaxID=2589382 RepID=UPI00355AD68B
MSINPLSNPKGIKLLCELCQKPAFVQCTDCRVTYYCGIEHQKTDWQGVHEKICQLLIPLRTQLPFLTSEEERENRKQWMLQQKMDLIDLTRTTGQKLLFEGKHEKAVPAALQSLKFAIDVYGLASINLVPSYLILGEASIGLNRLEQAEEYLMQANWTVLKTPECSNAIKSRLYRNLGLLYAAKGDYNEALRQLADDIYHSAQEFGTDDIKTAGGYYHMANIFFRKNQMSVADSLYTRVIDIWHKHLSGIIKVRTKTPLVARGPGPVFDDDIEEEDRLDEAQEAEAKQVLNAILDMREQSPGNNKEQIKILHALAMLQFLFKDLAKGNEYCMKATELIGSDDTTDEAQGVEEFSKICQTWVFTPAISVRRSRKVASKQKARASSAVPE